MKMCESYGDFLFTIHNIIALTSYIGLPSFLWLIMFSQIKFSRLKIVLETLVFNSTINLTLIYFTYF